MGDHDQFLALLLGHEMDLRAFIGSLVLDRHSRDDVFQEVALTLWEKFDRYDSQHSFGGWARGIAANKILKQRENRGRFPLCLSPSAVQALRDAFDRTEEVASRKADAMDECVKLLPQKARQLLTMRYYDELKPADIAQQTGRTVDSIYQSLSRLRAKLEECIRRRASLETKEA